MLPAVGYDHPDQSHFTSRHFWEVGATDTRLLTGWMGRYLDLAGSADNPLQGLSMTGSLQPTLATVKVPVAAIQGPDEYGFWVPGVWGEVENRMLDAIGSLGSVHSSDPAFNGVANVTTQVDRLRRQLAPFSGKAAAAAPVTYPKSSDSFPKRLQGLAAMVGAGLPLRCVALEATGQYDTHASQVGELEPASTTTAASLFAFQRDLEARGVADRVLTLVWTEFGRRAKENGSGGTDHGSRRNRIPDRNPGGRHSGRRVPGSRHGARRRRQPEGDCRFPRRLRGAARAVARLRRGARHPRRAQVRAAAPRQVKTLALVLGLLRGRRLVTGARSGRRARVLVLPLPHHGEAGDGGDRARRTSGRTPHDLRVRRVGASHIAGTKVAEAGGRTELTVRLLPGRYSFWCSVADHRARGMRATLIVRR